jgi:P27 family predicted phage terminase small subunit
VLLLIGKSLRQEDMAVLASYCLNYARWRAAEMLIEEHGTEIVIRDDKGVLKTLMPNPQVGISTKYHDRMLKSALGLGLTAGGRSAVTKSNPNQTARVGDELDVDALLASVN